MNRYRITPTTNIQQADDGQWVRWDEVQRLTEIAGENAVRLDLFHKTLVEIATVPLSIPNSQAAVKRAQDVLSQASDTFGKITDRFTSDD